MNFDEMIAVWKKYEMMNFYIKSYTDTELQEMSDVGLIIPAQARYLGLKNVLDDNTYHQRYYMFLIYHSRKRLQNKAK